MTKRKKNTRANDDFYAELQTLKDLNVASFAMNADGSWSVTFADMKPKEELATRVGFSVGEPEADED